MSAKVRHVGVTVPVFVICVGFLPTAKAFVKVDVSRDAVVQQKVSPVASRAPSLLPAGREWQLAWHDEFDGHAIDRSKWMCRTHFWGKRFKAFADDFRGVELDGDGHMRLNLLRIGDDFVSPHLQTGSIAYDIPSQDPKSIWPFGPCPKPLFLHRFGYYEIRCRLPKNDGWHCAFWLQSPCLGAHPDPRRAGMEIDIMENYRQFTENSIVCGPGWRDFRQEMNWPGHFQFEIEKTEDGWHHYGVHWTPGFYDFYADGKFVGRRTGPISHVEQILLVSTEAHGYRETGGVAGGLEDVCEWGGRPDKLLFNVRLPDYFEVDYVRVFDEVPLPQVE